MRFLLLLLLLLPTSALAQIPPFPSPPQVPPTIANNSAVSNITGSAAVPVGNTITTILDSALGSTVGSIAERGASGWQLVTPGTSGLPLVSGGVGANPTYTQIGTTAITGTWTTNQTFPQILFTGASGNGINDQSAVAGNSSTFWPGSVPTQRVNRLMVGIEAGMNLGCSPPQSWLTTLTGGICAVGQIQVISTLGVAGIFAGARSQDERAALGTPSGGSAGGYFFGVNDDTTVSTPGPIALGTNSVGVHRSGVVGITLGAQQDIDSAASTCVPTPSSSLCAGQASTIGNLITAGAFSSLATQDVTEGLLISSGATAKFNAAIVIDVTAVRSAVGPTILGASSTIGIAIPDTNYIIWYNGTSPNSAVWGGSGGSLNFFVSNTLVVNGVPGVNCTAGTVNTSFTVVTNGLVTHC